MPRNARCRKDVTDFRSALVALALHFSQFGDHEKALALLQLAGATEALLCDSTLWKRFLARNVDGDRSVLDGSRKLSCSGDHTANLVPVVEDMAWFLPDDDEDATETSFSALALALDKLALATVSKDKIVLDGGETLLFINEAFRDLHGPPVPGHVPGLDWDFAGLMTAFVTLGLGTKEARDLMDLMIVMIMNCRTGRSSFDSLVHDGYIKDLLEALWALSRRVKKPTADLVATGRAVRALEASRATLAALQDGTLEAFAALPGGDDVVSVEAALEPVAAFVGARARVVSVDGALALVDAALQPRRALFATRRAAALRAFFGDDVNTDDPEDFCGNDWTGGGPHIQILRDAVDHVMDTNRQNIEIAGVARQGAFRAAMAGRVRDGETLRVVIATNHVRYLAWLRGQRLVEPFKVMVRSEDVFDGRSTYFPSDRSVFFTEAAYAMVLVMLRVASEIAGRPVTFEEAGINIASVSVELQAFFAHKRKRWVLIGAVGRQIGICNPDGTVSWDVDNDGQRCAGSRYFKAVLPSDEAVPSLRGVMDIVRDDATTAMIVGDKTCEQMWRGVVEEGYGDPKKGTRLWALFDERYAAAVADALLCKSGAFLKSDEDGGLEQVVVAFAGGNIGSGKKPWHTKTFGEVAQTAADGGATFFSGMLHKKENKGKYDLVVLAPDYNRAYLNLPSEVKERDGAVHLDFVAVATKLQEHGLAGAAMNAELRAHWAAYVDTGREAVNASGCFKVFEKRDPPSEPLPVSLRDEYGRHFETWAADREAAARALRAEQEALRLRSARQAGRRADELSDSDLRRVGDYTPEDLRLARATMADPDASPEEERAASGILLQRDFVDSSEPRVAPPSTTWSLEKETEESKAELKAVEDRAAERTGGHSGVFGEEPNYQCPALPCGDYPDGLLFRAGGGTAASAFIDNESLDSSGGSGAGEQKLAASSDDEELSDASSLKSSDEDGTLGDGPPPARARSTRRAAAVATQNLAEQSDSDSAMDDEDDSSESDN